MTKEKLRGGIGNQPLLNFDDLLTHQSERPEPAAPVERANTRVNISEIRPLEDGDQPVRLKPKRSKREVLAVLKPTKPAVAGAMTPEQVPELSAAHTPQPLPPTEPTPETLKIDVQRWVMRQRSHKAAGLLLFVSICALLTVMFYLDLGLIATAITVVVVGIAGLSLQRAIAAVLNFAFGIGVYAATTLVLLLSVVAVCSIVTGGIWWRGSVVGAVILGMLSFMGHVLLRVSTDKEQADAMKAMAANRT